MSIDSVIDILRRCHKKETKKYHEDFEKEIKNDSLEKLKEDVQAYVGNVKSNVSSIEYASLNRLLATCDLKSDNEIKAVSHLVESHAVIFRQNALHRYAKMRLRESFLETPQTFGLNSKYVTIKPKNLEAERNVRSMLAELPGEWYTIQVTSQYGNSETLKWESAKQKMHALHISVLPTGSNAIDPFCVTVPKPKLYNNYDICNTVQEILVGNKSLLLADYKTNKSYWKMREKQDDKMKFYIQYVKTAIRGLEYEWLREWRILFMADFIEDSPLTKDITQMIDKLISESKISSRISIRTKWLLNKIALSACFLTRDEIARAVRYLIPNNKKLVNNIVLSIYGKLPCMDVLKVTKRKNLILIIDEHIDYIPFESMNIVERHPVTRFPSLHIAYALFKEHESSIQNGCKIIKAKDLLGKYIVNPARNLEKMEKRIRSFIEYWLPHWEGTYGSIPTEDMFTDTLIKNDVLMYCGHGNGGQYVTKENIQKLRVKAIVLLFGCSSIKLLYVGGRYPPDGISNHYLIATSPCMLGALWEVTDLDIDKLTTHFISSWILSVADHPWFEINSANWCNSGDLLMSKSCKKQHDIKEWWEPEMLRALACSKDKCARYMTKSAVIVRGLPVKFE